MAARKGLSDETSGCFGLSEKTVRELEGATVQILGCKRCFALLKVAETCPLSEVGCPCPS